MIDYFNLLIEQNEELLRNVYDKILDLRDSNNFIETLLIDNFKVMFYPDVCIITLSENLSFLFDIKNILNNEKFIFENVKKIRITKKERDEKIDLDVIVEFFKEEIELNINLKEKNNKKYKSNIYQLKFNKNETISFPSINLLNKYSNTINKNYSFFEVLKNIPLSNKEIQDLKKYLFFNEESIDCVYEKIKEYKELLLDNYEKIEKPINYRINIKNYKTNKSNFKKNTYN